MSAADVPADLPRFSRPVVATPPVAADRPGGDRRDLLVRAFLAWLPIVATLVVVSGLVYLTAQQSLRSGANDPQLEIAGDLAAQLGSGAGPGPSSSAGRSPTSSGARTWCSRSRPPG